MAPSRKRVKLDDLQWKAVEVPRLDDYEGFFGLEEIDEVEVIRDTDSKSFSFTAREATEASDFEGFSDSEEPSVLAPKGILRHPNGRQSPERQDNKRHKDGKAKKVKATKHHVTSGEVPLNALADDVDGEVDVSAWQSLGLQPDTLAGLSKLGFKVPTPIQRQTIPAICCGDDVIGKASTGSGKTLAFGIPIFEAWLEKAGTAVVGSGPLALIITPTRELAHQIGEHLSDLSKGLPRIGPVIATITGGLSLQKQRRLLARAAIAVGTPGRIWEVISGSQEDLQRMKGIRFLVLDEADRLLSQGNFKELEEVLKAIDRVDTNDDNEQSQDGIESQDANQRRQTLVFSATLQKDLQHKLAKKQKGHYHDIDKKESMEYLLKRLQFRTKPKFIDVDPVRQMAANLKEGIVECGGQEKDLYLYSVHLLHEASRTLVFVNSISAVRRLVPFLQNLGLPALALHSQMPQKARLRSIERFSSTSPSTNGTDTAQKVASILVATDVAARGLDIPDIDLILHYHLPRSSDAYIHRSGRTARAGKSGSSILLCSPEEVAGVRRLVAQVHASSAAASNLSKAEAARRGYMIRSLDIDRRVVQRLLPRVQLAKRIADVGIAKEKSSSSANFFKEAAEDLGVEYDSEELERTSLGKRGRGAGRRQREREDREVSGKELRALRGELKALLGRRINVGVSERYPTSGGIDFEELLREGGKSEFLGTVNHLNMDD